MLNTEGTHTVGCEIVFKILLEVIKDEAMFLGSRNTKGSEDASMKNQVGEFDDEMPLKAPLYGVLPTSLVNVNNEMLVLVQTSPSFCLARVRVSDRNDAVESFLEI